MSISPMVSVCMITYNHEPYIVEAIEGVLMQQTTFSIELIISEDCSTDNTRKKIKEYANKYPDIIVADLPERNRGMMVNFHHCMSLAQGKYIALCEGDDYWTDPLKLQKQVDFLEANSKYGMCYTKAYIYDEASKSIQKRVYGKILDNVRKIKELCIPTQTVVLRKELLKEYLEEIEDFKEQLSVGDYPLWLWFYLNSKVYLIDEITSVYRVLLKSASHISNENEKISFINSFFDMQIVLSHKYNFISMEEIENSRNRDLANYYFFIFNNPNRAYKYFSKISNLSFHERINKAICSKMFFYKVYSILRIIKKHFK